MTADDTDIITHVNELAERRFALEVATNQLKQRHAAELAKLDQQVADTDSELWQLVTHHRAALIDPGKQSFVTVVAQVAFRKVGGSIKLINPGLALDIARQLGIVRKIGKLHVKWVVDRTKLLAWLDTNNQDRESFEECIEEIAAHESLSIKPNANYTVRHGTERISPPPLTIQSPAPPAANVS